MLNLLDAVLVLSLADTLVDIVRWIVELPVRIFQAYSSALRWAADSVHSLFDQYGYWVIFFGTLVENTLLLGLIVPGLIVVVLAGLAAQDGAMSFPIATALGILGTVIGDTISYFMGRFGWARFGHMGSLREFSEKVREPILRKGPMFVLLYHFAGYTRVVGPAGAGLLRMPYRRWAPADYTGAALWVTTYMAIGYGLGLLGLSLDSTDRWFRVVEWALLGLFMVWGYLMLQAGQRALQEHLGAKDEDERAPPVEARAE
jgi:membrane protein DedA with SNARE-associated domain